MNSFKPTSKKINIGRADSQHSSFREWSRSFFGKHLPIRQKFFNVVFCFAGIVWLILAFAGLASGASTESVTIYFSMSILFPILGFWGGTVKERRDIILYISLGFMSFIVFPVLYMATGGIDGGSPLFFVLGITLTLFLTQSFVGLGMAITEAIVYILTIWFSYTNPQWIITFESLYDEYARNHSFNSVIANVFIVTTTLGLLTRKTFNLLVEEDRLVKDSIVEIKRQATIDPLTNVYNRRYMYSYLTQQVNEAKETGMPLSLAIFDIDKFKLLNDNYGHLVGDEVLKAVSKIIKGACRPGEIVARYGGEEFVLILPNLDNETAYNRANEIRECIEQSYLSPELPKDKPVTISGGVATYVDGFDEEKLVACADENLYNAKENGRNRIVK